MPTKPSSRRTLPPAIVLAFTFTTTASAQNPTPIAAIQPTQQQPSVASFTTAAPAQPIRRAKIDFANGHLTISAENASLDQILSDIAYLTGMKITGGVADERVFGTYGPDSPQAVLSTLLDGTGANMLLLETPQHTVQELILTPRNGGPTPPTLNASSAYERDETDRPSMPGGRRERPFPDRRFPPNFGNQQVPGNSQIQPNPVPYNQAQPNPSNEAAPAAIPTIQQSPNGVKTPQQIFQELMQQQQQQRTPPPQP